jgi:hypothetical protein
MKRREIKLFNRKFWQARRSTWTGLRRAWLEYIGRKRRAGGKIAPEFRGRYTRDALRIPEAAVIEKREPVTFKTPRRRNDNRRENGRRIP